MTVLLSFLHPYQFSPYNRLFFVADLYSCIKDHATHTKSRGLMSLPLTRSASRPLMRQAKGPSPPFTHSPHRSLLLPL